MAQLLSREALREAPTHAPCPTALFRDSAGVLALLSSVTSYSHGDAAHTASTHDATAVAARMANKGK